MVCFGGRNEDIPTKWTTRDNEALQTMLQNIFENGYYAPYVLLNKFGSKFVAVRHIAAPKLMIQMAIVMELGESFHVLSGLAELGQPAKESFTLGLLYTGAAGELICFLLSLLRMEFLVMSKFSLVTPLRAGVTLRGGDCNKTKEMSY